MSLGYGNVLIVPQFPTFPQTSNASVELSFLVCLVGDSSAPLPLFLPAVLLEAEQCMLKVLYMPVLQTLILARDWGLNLFSSTYSFARNTLIAWRG